MTAWCMTTILLCDAYVVCLCGTHIYPLTSNSLDSGLDTGYIDVWEHFGGGRHVDADWSPIFEDLYSPELGNPLRCRGSACVEVMTTLHGNACLSGRRRGLRLLMVVTVDQFMTTMVSIQLSLAIQDETPYDSLPHSPPPLGLTVPRAPPYLLHGHSEVASPAVVHTTVLEDTYACMDRIERSCG
ncbi:hypothetical protein AAG906_001798 [Vitis piasezkii]